MKRALRGLAVLIVFAAAYGLSVAALVLIEIVLGLVDPKSATWPFWTSLGVGWLARSTIYAPTAVAALLAAWYAGLSMRGTTLLLGTFLAMILAVAEATYIALLFGPPNSRVALWVLFGGLPVLAGVFFAIAHICRRRVAQRLSR